MVNAINLNRYEAAKGQHFGKNMATSKFNIKSEFIIMEKNIPEKESYTSHFKDEIKLANLFKNSTTIKELLNGLKEEMRDYFDAEAFTIYFVDHKNQQLVSKIKAGRLRKEIRLPIDKKSIAGFVALTGSIINIVDAYDIKELQQIDPELNFNHTRDDQSTFKTTQVLSAPVFFQQKLFGVIQLLNKKSSSEFTSEDINSIKIIAEALEHFIAKHGFSSKKSKYEIPEKDKKDIFHAVTRAGLGSFPFVGAAASELFNLIISPSLEKRKEKWMEDIAEALKSLERQNVISFENLSENEVFINTTLYATRAALRTNLKEKLTALRNAVINSALPNSPDEDTQQIFLNLIDIFTQWHLRILEFLKNPPLGGIPIRTGNTYVHLSNLPEAIEQTYPELQGRYNFYNQIIKELSDRGLVNMSASDTTHDMAGIPSTQVTQWGDNFLSFVKSPFKKDE